MALLYMNFIYDSSGGTRTKLQYLKYGVSSNILENLSAYLCLFDTNAIKYEF